MVLQYNLVVITPTINAQRIQVNDKVVRTKLNRLRQGKIRDLQDGWYGVVYKLLDGLGLN